MTLLVGQRGGAFEVRLQMAVAQALAKLGEPCIQTANYYGDDVDTLHLVTLWSSVLPKVDRIFFMRHHWTDRFGFRLHQIANTVSPATQYFTIQDLIISVASGKLREEEVQAFLQQLPDSLSYLELVE